MGFATELSPEVTEITADATLTHIIDCPDDKESSAEWLVEARANKLPIEALCGYVWVPELDPTRYPVCETCLDIAQIRVVDF